MVKICVKFIMFVDFLVIFRKIFEEHSDDLNVLAIRADTQLTLNTQHKTPIYKKMIRIYVNHSILISIVMPIFESRAPDPLRHKLVIHIVCTLLMCQQLLFNEQLGCLLHTT